MFTAWAHVRAVFPVSRPIRLVNAEGTNADDVRTRSRQPLLSANNTALETVGLQVGDFHVGIGPKRYADQSAMIT